MTDTQRAMLGDREAGRRLADQGRLIPCQHGYEAMIVSSGGNWPQELYRVITRRHCCMQSTFYGSRRSAARAWNCRAQLLTPEQFGRLESGGEVLTGYYKSGVQDKLLAALHIMSDGLYGIVDANFDRLMRDHGYDAPDESGEDEDVF